MKLKERGIKMLKRFEVTNFKGFKDKLVFDLTSKEYKFNSAIIKEGIVNKAIVYGKNGTGKSSLGIALFDITAHLTDNERIKNKYVKNYINLASDKDFATFTFYFVFDGNDVKYEYIKKDLNFLIKESLYINGEEVISYDFFDKKDNFISKELIGNLNVDLEDNKLSIIKYIYRNTPTGTAPVVSSLVEYVEGMLWYRSLSDGNQYCGFTNGSNILDEEIYRAGKLQEFENFLKENGVEYKLTFVNVNGVNIIYVIFDNGKKAPLSEIASTGTSALFLYFCWSISFKEISLLFIDEFDAFFHFEAAENIVMQLNKAKNFQSILTSHNTYLMQNRLTRPDCCYIITNGRITSLYDATDKDIREGHNLEKMYINGVFTE